MKKKSFNTKLVLNKQTVANLNENEMTSVKGGGDKTAFTLVANCQIDPYTRECNTMECMGHGH